MVKPLSNLSSCQTANAADTSPRSATISTSSWWRCWSITRSTPARRYSISASTTSPVDVVAEYEVKVAGRTWQLIEFTLAFGATTFHFVNAYATGEGYGSSQIALWTLPPLVDELYRRANDVIAGVSFPTQ